MLLARLIKKGGGGGAVGAQGHACVMLEIKKEIQQGSSNMKQEGKAQDIERYATYSTT